LVNSHIYAKVLRLVNPQLNQQMQGISDYIFYGIMFFSVYVQIFFLFTFFENRKKILSKNPLGVATTTYTPSITIIVPCYNEERSIAKTMNSLLALDYPKDKLEIMVVDDGSKDKTWEIVWSVLTLSSLAVWMLTPQWTRMLSLR
jgi:hyaluronan synthase